MVLSLFFLNLSPSLVKCKWLRVDKKFFWRTRARRVKLPITRSMTFNLWPLTSPLHFLYITRQFRRSRSVDNLLPTFDLVNGKDLLPRVGQGWGQVLLQNIRSEPSCKASVSHALVLTQRQLPTDVATADTSPCQMSTANKHVVSQTTDNWSWQHCFSDLTMFGVINVSNKSICRFKNTTPADIFLLTSRWRAQKLRYYSRISSQWTLA